MLSGIDGRETGATSVGRSGSSVPHAPSVRTKPSSKSPRNCTGERKKSRTSMEQREARRRAKVASVGHQLKAPSPAEQSPVFRERHRQAAGGSQSRLGGNPHGAAMIAVAGPTFFQDAKRPLPETEQKAPWPAHISLWPRPLDGLGTLLLPVGRVLRRIVHTNKNAQPSWAVGRWLPGLDSNQQPCG